MSVFEELKEARNFDAYVAMAQKELDVEVAESKQIHILAKSLVKKLVNSEGFIDSDEKVSLYELCYFMTGAMIVGMAAKDEIKKDAKEFVEKYDMVMSKDELVEEI